MSERTDPICGMKVDKQNPRGNHEFEGMTYYCGFFAKDPQQYQDTNYQPTMGHI
jgi:YHS domain-containing protein